MLSNEREPGVEEKLTPTLLSNARVDRATTLSNFTNIFSVLRVSAQFNYYDQKANGSDMSCSRSDVYEFQITLNEAYPHTLARL